MHYIGNIIYFNIYLFTQILFFSNISFEYIVTYTYIGFLLSLPFNINTINKMIIGFLLGIIIDVYYETLGVHAFSSVLIMFLSPKVERLIDKKYKDTVKLKPVIRDMGFNWFFSYTFILVFIHHFCVFYLEAGFTQYFMQTLFKIILSTLLTFSLLYILDQILFRKRIK